VAGAPAVPPPVPVPLHGSSKRVSSKLATAVKRVDIAAGFPVCLHNGQRSLTIDRLLPCKTGSIVRRPNRTHARVVRCHRPSVFRCCMLHVETVTEITRCRLSARAVDLFVTPRFETARLGSRSVFRLLDGTAPQQISGTHTLKSKFSLWFWTFCSVGLSLSDAHKTYNARMFKCTLNNTVYSGLK